MKRERVEMRIPESILKEIDEYKERNGVASRTATILELVRKALDQDKKDRSLSPPR